MQQKTFPPDKSACLIELELEASTRMDPLDPEIDFDPAAARQQRAQQQQLRRGPPQQQHQQQQRSHAQHAGRHQLPPPPPPRRDGGGGGPPHLRPPFQQHGLQPPPMFPGQPFHPMPLPPTHLYASPNQQQQQQPPTQPMMPFPPQFNPAAAFPPNPLMPPMFPMGLPPPGILPTLPPPPPPTAPPTEENAWSQHPGPNGIPYYFNSPPPPPPGPPPSAVNSSEAKSEKSDSAPSGFGDVDAPLALKKLPNSVWAIVLTTKDHEFFLNLETRVTTWEMPDEIGELVGQIMADPGGFGDEGEESDEAEGIVGAVDESELLGGAGSKRPRDEADGADGAHAKRQRNLLREKDVNPFSPWDKELVKIVHDDRYTLFPSIKERKHQFEAFCRIRSAEIREEQRKKTLTSGAGSSSASASDPRSQFMSLLAEDTTITMHTSTTSGYDDFARRWRKKDPRFSAVSDDRDRKAYFKDHIAGLKQKEVEKRRDERKKVVAAFNELLKEAGVQKKSEWKDVRRRIEGDPRYLAVRTPIEREDMFRDYVKKLVVDSEVVDENQRKELERKERIEASLRMREEEVRRQKHHLQRESMGQKGQLMKEEATLALNSMLADHIKNHQTTLEEALSVLTADPRWATCESALPRDEIVALYRGHTARLYNVKLSAFKAFIEEYAPDPTTPFSAVAAYTEHDARARRMAAAVGPRGGGGDDGSADEKNGSSGGGGGGGGGALERLYVECQRARIDAMRTALREAVLENSFVAFCMKRAVQTVEAEMADESSASLAAAGKEREISDEAVWKHVGLDEINEVLKKDKRFLDFGFDGSERDRIVFAAVKSLMATFKAERGGTLDHTIAKHAGGFGAFGGEGPQAPARAR
ncbi:hypothetical protein DFJ73DRAFT_914409 [Zopfochytrium polystomum]|nr:hypothetical protein DFJ73DRAFT_914409 [Zopfochytrium polystomum]